MVGWMAKPSTVVCLDGNCEDIACSESLRYFSVLVVDNRTDEFQRSRVVFWQYYFGMSSAIET